MLYFLNFQSTYTTIEYSLWNRTICIETSFVDKMEASKTLVSKLDTLLKKHACSLESISFVVANKGPGPFTTLRVLIATLNGLSFAKKIPLIGIDGLDAFAYEYQNNTQDITIVLLNAYNNDVYFGIYNKTALLHKGISSMPALLLHVQEKYTQNSIQWLGNGVLLHQKAILELFSQQSYMLDPLPEFCSLNTIALLGKEKWDQKDDITTMLLPLYLKQAINKGYCSGI